MLSHNTVSLRNGGQQVQSSALSQSSLQHLCNETAQETKRNTARSLSSC